MWPYPEALCAMHLYTALMSGPEGRFSKLPAACAARQVTLDALPQHRARGDAEATRRIVVSLLAEVPPDPIEGDIAWHDLGDF